MNAPAGHSSSRKTAAGSWLWVAGYAITFGLALCGGIAGAIFARANPPPPSPIDTGHGDRFLVELTHLGDSSGVGALVGFVLGVAVSLAIFRRLIKPGSRVRMVPPQLSGVAPAPSDSVPFAVMCRAANWLLATVILHALLAALTLVTYWASTPHWSFYIFVFVERVLPLTLVLLFSAVVALMAQLFIRKGSRSACVAGVVSCVFAVTVPMLVLRLFWTVPDSVPGMNRGWTAPDQWLVWIGFLNDLPLIPVWVALHGYVLWQLIWTFWKSGPSLALPSSNPIHE